MRTHLLTPCFLTLLLGPALPPSLSLPNEQSDMAAPGPTQVRRPPTPIPFPLIGTSPPDRLHVAPIGQARQNAEIPETQDSSSTTQHPNSEEPTTQPQEAPGSLTDCDEFQRREEFRAESEAALRVADSIPDWIRDASWYYIDVPSFRNGDRSNDSPDTPPWGVKRVFKSNALHKSLYGGDLQGVREKLPYLKQLGVNALILNGVFTARVPFRRADDLLSSLHVNDSVAVAGSIQKVTGETTDPATWTFSDSDRLFLDIVSDARAHGFRVLVMYPHPGPASAGCTGPPLYFYDYADFIWKMNERWLRKQADHDAGSGIDGWADSDVYSGVQRIFAVWRARIKRVNPDAALVGLNQLIREDDNLEVGKQVDALVYTEPSEFVARAFHLGSQVDISELLARHDTMRRRWPECVRQGHLGFFDPRLINCLGFRNGQFGSPAPVEAAQIMTPEMIDLWRLAIVFQLTYSSEYVLPFGEEVGLVHEGPPWYPEPMWWSDLSNPESKKPAFRADFFELVRSLNALRSRHPALRRGSFKSLLVDDQTRLFAFSRSWSGQEVIVAMNAGSAPRQVLLKLGSPAQPVEILNPVFAPRTSDYEGQAPRSPGDPLRSSPDRIETTKDRLNAAGEIDFRLEAKSACMIFVNDDPP